MIISGIIGDMDQRQWAEVVLADILPDPIVVLDQKRKICFANKAAAVMAGYESVEKILDTPYINIINQGRVLDQDGFPMPLESYPSNQAFTEGKETKDEIIQWINKEKEHYWFSISSFPFFVENNQERRVEYVAVIFKDISDSKLHDDRLKFLIDSSKVLSIDADLDARLREKARLLVPRLADWCTINVINDEGILTRVAIEHRNPAKCDDLAKLASLAAENPNVSKGIKKVIEAQVSEFYPTILPDRIAPGAYSDEYIALEKKLTPCSAMIIPIIAGKRTLGVLSLAYSSSESGRSYTKDDLEFMENFGYHLAAIIENARLYGEITKRDRNRDIFLATLSHELRNPLGPIKNSLELLKIKNKDSDLQEEIEIIEHQFDHIAKLLGDLMAVNRITHGKFELDKRPVELSSIITTACKTTRPMAIKKNVEISLALPSHQMWILADSYRIEQIMTNLLHNAEKFTDEGGHITVNVRQEGNEAVVEVHDDGIGIEKKDLKKIFDLYFQGSRRTRSYSSGLGMGLLLVQEIVRLHGGSVEAKSDGPGLGSTFIVRLPLANYVEPIRETSEKPAANVPYYKKILIVDDNRAVADSLAKLLKMAGYELEISYSARESFSVLKRFNPDLAIIDIGMPDIDGYGLARMLRDDHITIPLIAFSGYGTEKDKKLALEAGFNHHLTKPVGLGELKEVFKLYL